MERWKGGIVASKILPGFSLTVSPRFRSSTSTLESPSSRGVSCQRLNRFRSDLPATLSMAWVLLDAKVS